MTWLVVGAVLSALLWCALVRWQYKGGWVALGRLVLRLVLSLVILSMLPIITDRKGFDDDDGNDDDDSPPYYPPPPRGGKGRIGTPRSRREARRRVSITGPPRIRDPAPFVAVGQYQKPLVSISDRGFSLASYETGLRKICCATRPPKVFQRGVPRSQAGCSTLLVLMNRALPQFKSMEPDPTTTAIDAPLRSGWVRPVPLKWFTEFRQCSRVNGREQRLKNVWCCVVQAPTGDSDTPARRQRVRRQL